MTDCDLYLNVFIPAITDHAINSDMQRCCDISIPLTKCDKNGNILEINITRDKGLVVGAIPPSINQFKSLEALYLNDNALQGSYPSTLSQISTLKYLNLSGNKLTGSLPASLSSLPTQPGSTTTAATPPKATVTVDSPAPSTESKSGIPSIFNGFRLSLIVFLLSC